MDDSQTRCIVCEEHKDFNNSSAYRSVNSAQPYSLVRKSISPFGTSRKYVDVAPQLIHISKSINSWGQCRLGALTEEESGIAVYGNNGYATIGIKEELLSKIKEINDSGKTIKSVTITKMGYYCMVYERNGWFGDVPESLKTILNQYNKDMEDIYCVSIADNGDYVAISNEHFCASNPTDYERLNEANILYGCVKFACTTARAICVVCENGIYYHNIPSKLETTLKNISFKPDKVEFTDSGTYLITNDRGTPYDFWL